MLDPVKDIFTVTGLRALITKIVGGLATKVAKTDVVSSWQSTPDDAHVPTEKLVKDTLDNLPPGTAVKGDAESEYRTGNVNLTPANIGAYSKTESDSRYKAVQNPVSDPAASGSGLSFIDSVSQDANGVITPHKKTVQDGTTAQKGVVQLNNAINSTSTTEAATPKAVKDAYDALNNKIVARAVFLSQQEWAAQSLLPGDPAKVYYVENGTGEDAYTVYVWKESTSEYVEVDESSIDLDGYWHDSPTTTGSGNVVTNIALGNDGVPQVEKGMSAEPAFSVLPVNKGGTGADTIKGALSTLTSETQHYDTLPTDDTLIVHKFDTATASNGALYTRKLSYLWTYIQNKISSVLGLTASSYSGKAATAVNNEDSVQLIKGMYAMESSSYTIPDLIDEIRVLHGARCGSVRLDSTYTKNNVTIGLGWFNFEYIPHRGNATGDSANYGTLLLSGMTVTTTFYVLCYCNGKVDHLWQLTNTEGTYPNMSVGSATTATNYESGGGIANAINAKQDTISDLTTIRSGASAGATALQPSGNGSNLSVTPDGSSTGYDLGSSTTLKAWAQMFKNLVGSLKALAFKDTAAYSDLSSGVQSSLDNADAAIKTIECAAGSNINVVGTPSVSSTNDPVNHKTTLTFNYLKGEKGDQGNPGADGTVIIDNTYTYAQVKSLIDSGKEPIYTQAGWYYTLVRNNTNQNRYEFVSFDGYSLNSAYVDANGWNDGGFYIVDQTYSSSSIRAQSGTAVAQAIATKLNNSYATGVLLDKGAQTLKRWAKIATVTFSSSEWNGKQLTLAVSPSGYNSGNALLGIITLGITISNGSVTSSTRTAYWFKHSLNFDCEVVINNGTIELWCYDATTDTDAYFNQISNKGFTLHYGNNRDQQLTESDYVSYKTGKTVYTFDKYTLVRSAGQKGTTTKPVYVKDDGTVENCSSELPSGYGTSGQYLKSNGSGNAPSWDNPNNLNVGRANKLNYLNTNEINFTNVPSSNYSGHYFNHVNGDTNSVDSSKKITDYYFEDRNGSSENVILHAGGITNRQYNSGYGGDGYDAELPNCSRCIRFTLNSSNSTFAIRCLFKTSDSSINGGFVDLFIKTATDNHWDCTCFVSRSKMSSSDMGKVYYHQIDNTVYIVIKVGSYGNKCTPILLSKDGTVNVEFGDYSSVFKNYPSSNPLPSYINVYAPINSKVGGTSTPVYVDTDGSVKQCTNVNADTVDGKHIVVGTLGSAANTIYFLDGT